MLFIVVTLSNCMARRKVVSVVQRAFPVLYVIRHCSLCSFKTIIKDKHFSKEIIQAIRELAYNYLQAELPLTKKQKRQLKSKLHLLKHLCKETKPNILQKIILKNRKTVTNIILEPIETSLYEILQK